MKKRNGKLFMLLMTAGLVLGMFTGCGSSKAASNTMDQAAVEEVSEEKTDQAASEASEDSASQATTEGTSQEAPKIDTSSMYNRKVIKEGDMNIQTEKFTKTVESLMKKLKAVNGYIESMDMGGQDYYDQSDTMRSATITVRVPQERFDELINSGNELGNVVSISCNTQDVTGEYVDAQTRLEVLKTRYDRLLELMSKVTKYEDIFKFEKEIADVEYEINSYEGKLNQFDSVVDFSTLRITIEEVSQVKEDKDEQGFSAQLKDGLRDSWQGVKTIVKIVLLILARFLPYLILLVPLGLIIWRFCIKSNSKSKKEEHADSKEKDHKEE